MGPFIVFRFACTYFTVPVVTESYFIQLFTIALYIFLNKVDVSAKAFIFLVPFVFALFYTAVFIAACLAASCAVDHILKHRSTIASAMEEL